MSRLLMIAAVCAALWMSGCASAPKASQLKLSMEAEPTFAEIAMTQVTDHGEI